MSDHVADRSFKLERSADYPWYAGRRWIGNWNTGVHKTYFTADLPRAVSVWVGGWSGGVNGKPVYRGGIIMRSVQVEDSGGGSATVYYEFEVTDGPTELCVNIILCGSESP